MPTTEITTTKVTGPQKAAILIVALGDKVGGELMKQLNEEEVKAVSKAIARLDKVTPSQTEAVLEEFCQMTGAGGAAAAGSNTPRKCSPTRSERKAPSASRSTFLKAAAN